MPPDCCIDARTYYIGQALNALIQKYGADKHLQDPNLMWVPKAIEIGTACAGASEIPTTPSPTPVPVAI